MGKSEHSEGSRRPSGYQQRRLGEPQKKNVWTAPPAGKIYAGYSVSPPKDGMSTAALAIRDTTYLLDFFQSDLPTTENGCDEDVVDYVITKLRQFSSEHFEKVMGLAMPQRLAKRCPDICSRLWIDLDVIPLALPEEQRQDGPVGADSTASIDWDSRYTDEQAESLGRKCVRLFGPDSVPLLQVGFQGKVEVDTDFHIRLVHLEDFEKTVSDRTWAAVEYYAAQMKERKTRMAFFSATPQGGGVALMRHSLVRFAHFLGIDISWYVPKPRPGVFRITKSNHNILQGVSQPDERLKKSDRDQVTDWIKENARRYWLSAGGPLVHPSQGGANIIVVDDPQMIDLIRVAKEKAPERPVIFRSHIHMRSDLITKPDSPQAEVWQWLWNSVKQADVFISHPMSYFVPPDVDREKVGYMPASTDWLDGLNKPMRDWDYAFYGRCFNSWCRDAGMPTIDYPEDEYIVQIARFDPSKGISDEITAYHDLYTRLTDPQVAKTLPLHLQKPPKLLVAGHGSVDDPDGSLIYDQVVSYIEDEMPFLRDEICVMRLRPSDQVLNVLLSKAKIVLQLSRREGFEIKVSEASHKGKPVIASRAGGLPLQIEHGKNGFLVDEGDTDAVVEFLFRLWTEEDLYRRMSVFARSHVSDEVSTVGNALNWLFFAAELAKGKDVVRPNEAWINDLARKGAGQPYVHGEPRLKRSVELHHTS